MPTVSTNFTETGARPEFFDRFDHVEKHWTTLAATIKSNHPSEKHPWLGVIPQVREWGNETTTGSRVGKV